MHREPFVKLLPVFKEYLWGGEKLKALYGAPLPRVAEAWLLSVHPDGPSVIAEGQYQGMPLLEYLRKQGTPEDFPILIKLIDSAQKLSVQVHPDNEYARIHENDHGKSEMWIVLEAEEGAYLYVGFNRDVTPDELRRRVENGTIETVLNKMPTRAGDMIYIPAGTVHAIGEGNLILEVQQSSNATYRLYDYNRRGTDGKLRPLHLKKALDVADCRRYAGAARPVIAQSAEFEYFGVERHAVSGEFTLEMTAERFAALVCVEGEGTVRRQGMRASINRGESLYLPAGAQPAAFSGELQLIVTRAAFPAAR